MNSVDWSVLALVLLSMVVGLFRGFVREVLSMLNWAIAAYVAYKCYPQLTPTLSHWISHETICHVVAFSLIFVLALFLGALVGHVIGYLFRKSGLNGTDRSLGLLFGLMRGVAVSIAGLLVASYTSFATSKTWQQAVVVPYAKPAMHWLGAHVQTEFNFPKDTAQQAEGTMDIEPEDQRLVNLSQMEAMAPGLPEA